MEYLVFVIKRLFSIETIYPLFPLTLQDKHFRHVIVSLGLWPSNNSPIENEQHTYRYATKIGGSVQDNENKILLTS